MSEQLSDQSQRSSTPCSECKASGRCGYCALGRCYCGHKTCPGFDSYIALSRSAAPAPMPSLSTSRRSAWDDRGGATWIDKL